MTRRNKCPKNYFMGGGDMMPEKQKEKIICE